MHKSKLTDEASFLNIQKNLEYDNEQSNTDAAGTEEDALQTKESKHCGSIAYVDVDSNDESNEESSHQTDP
jgi:hypothetical protein